MQSFVKVCLHFRTYRLFPSPVTPHHHVKYFPLNRCHLLPPLTSSPLCVIRLLFQQRRRWLNGTFCGYLWLLYKRPFYPTSSKSVPSIEGPVLLKKKEDAEEKSKEKENCKKQAMDGAKVESCKDDSSPELSSGTDDEAESLEYIYSSSSEEEKSEEDYKEEKGKDTEIPIIEDIPPAGNPLKITIPRLSHSNQQRFSNTPRSRDGSSRPGSGRSSSRSSSHRKSSKSDLLKSSRGGNYSARSNSSRDPKSARVGDYDDREGDAIRYQWRIPWYRLVPINILLFIQLWMNLWVYLGPAIFVSMFRYSLKVCFFFSFHGEPKPTSRFHVSSQSNLI